MKYSCECNCNLVGVYLGAGVCLGADVQVGLVLSAALGPLRKYPAELLSKIPSLAAKEHRSKIH